MHPLLICFPIVVWNCDVASQHDKITEFLISAPKAKTMLLIVLSKVYFSAKCNPYSSSS